MPIEHKNIQFAAGHRQLLIKANDHGIAIEIGIRTEDVRVVRPGMDNDAFDRSLYGGATWIRKVQSMMGTIAIACGRAKLIAWAGKTVGGEILKRVAQPEMIVRGGGQRCKGRPET